MPTEVVLPKVDNDMTVGKISKWFVAEDATVAKGEPLFEIETDKAAMEVEAPTTGTIYGIVAPEGGSAPVGSTVAWIAAAGEARLPAASPLAPTAAAPESSERPPPSLDEQHSVPTPPQALAAGGEKNVRATPLARRLARDHGVDLKLVVGSGRNGRIQSRDVPEPVAESPPHQRDAETDGLHRLWLRSGEGTPLVLVHGFGSQLAIWRPLLAGLATSNPILAVNLPGHGASPPPADMGFEALVDRLEAALVAENVQQAHLVGHSLGGAVVASLATRHAIEVRSLLLIAPAGLGPDIDSAFLDGFCRARSEASLAPWMRRLVADETHISDALVKATLQTRAGTGAAEEQARLAAALFPDGTQAFSVRHVFAELSVPVKIVVGGADRIIPAVHARGLPGTVAVHLFPHLGHMPHLEARAAIGRLLAEIIRAGA